MDLQLPERQAAELASLSMRTGWSASELAVEAVDRLLAQENWFDAQVQLGIDQMARGEFLEEEVMDARVARMMRA
jgi:predicted transcriptional regulator